nr:MAG TPA: hemagglutinin [Inoviridae sp.]
MTAGDTFTRKNALQVLDGLIYYLFNFQTAAPIWRGIRVFIQTRTLP